MTDTALEAGDVAAVNPSKQLRLTGILHLMAKTMQ